MERLLVVTAAVRVLLLGAALIPAAAAAQDGGSPEIPLVCGNVVDEDGRCYGQTAAWCRQPNSAGENPAATVDSADCAALGSACIEHPEMGAWCTAPDQAACAIATEAGTAQLLCGGGAPSPGPGCDLVDGCRDDAPLCSPQDAPKCANNDLVLACSPASQPLFIRCSGRCVAEPLGCEDEIEGRPCREGQLSCAEGLICLGDGPSGYGTCVASGDTATPSVDAGSWAPESPGAGCACTLPRRAPPLGLFAIGAAGLLLGRRPRRR